MTGTAQEAPPRSTGLRWPALVVLCSAFFLVNMDASVVLVALPSIGPDLHFAASQVQWVMSAYMISFGGLLLLGGRLGDSLGQRRLFLAGVGLFALSSLGAGTAGVAWAMLLARVGQGVGAAVMVPTALALLTAMFVEGSDRNRALSIWVATGGVGGAVAWVIGGVITDGVGWEWIFYINVPVTAAVLVLGPFLLPAARPTEARRRFDATGALTSTLALMLLVYAVGEGPHTGWTDPRTVGLLVSVLALIGLFLVVEKRSQAPLVPLRIFSLRTLAGGDLVLFAVGMLAFGVPFVLSRYGQQVLHWSASQFGVAFVVWPILTAAGSALGQSISSRGHRRTVAITGLILMGLAQLLFARVPVDGSYLVDLLPGIAVCGLGLGFGYVAGSIASLTGVGEDEQGLASGLSNASFQIGGALGVAVLSTVAANAGSGGLPALTDQFHTAFFVAIAFAVVGIVVVVLTQRGSSDPGRGAEQQTNEKE